MANSATNISAYRKVDVETASQGKIIVMLFNGAVQRVEEAKRLIGTNKYQTIHENLIKAQEIVTELRSSLDMQQGEVAKNLDRIYEYILHLLVKGNISKKPEPLDEAIDHLTTMRDTWKEAFAKIAEEGGADRPAGANAHGGSALNIRG